MKPDYFFNDMTAECCECGLPTRNWPAGIMLAAISGEMGLSSEVHYCPACIPWSLLTKADPINPGDCQAAPDYWAFWPGRVIDLPLIFVNAYEVDSCYGGPEEGGWWYDEGTVLASIPCQTQAQVIEARERLRTLLGHNYPAKSQRHTSRGGPDLCISVEEHVATAYPETRPHYE